MSSVYQTGPLRGLPIRGLPIRGPLPRTIVCPPIGDAMSAAPPRSAPALVWTHPGDTELNDPLAFPDIPADAPAPPIAVTEAPPFRSATPVVIILIASTLLILAVNILGRAA